jgi:hypothetical protein
MFVALILAPSSGSTSDICLMPGTDGLMEATSNLSFGIAQAASSLTRLRLNAIAGLPGRAVSKPVGFATLGDANDIGHLRV